MSKSSKRRAEASADSSEVKKVKTEKPTVVGCWEVEGDGGVWSAFLAVQNTQLSQAFLDGKESVELTNKNVPVSVVFERMVQRNTKTGFERRIRFNGKDGSAGENVWQSQSSDGDWTNFPAAACSLIDAAILHKLPKVSFKIPRQGNKEVDLQKMEVSQARKKGKQAIRKVSKDDPASAGTQNGNASNGVDAHKQSASASAAASKSGRGKKAAVKKEPSEADESPVVKSVVFKGKAPVDSECSIKDKVHVFSEGDTIWDAMLNQTNLLNNNNKYYLMQILQDNNTKKFFVWFRWGRVGFSGQNNLIPCGANLDEAKATFEKKFSDKTKNDWEDRNNFVKVKGKYDLIIMDYKVKDEVKKEKKKTDETDGKPVKKESLLDKRLQNLIELICNVQAMEDAVMEMKYDTKKAPLGNLTTDQIKAGYKALKKIDNCITKGETSSSELVKACDEFYTRIPHCFGMKRPPVIRTKEEVKLKIQLLEALGDIQVALKVMKEELKDLDNPIDRHYKAMNTGLEPLDHQHEEFKMVEKYTQNTHASTHSHYTLEVLDVFKVTDYRQEKTFKDYGNRKLLWHGSRLTNWFGILSQGLRIAPPEAPVTGYMFGKGIYFADMSSKSANYCFPTKTKNVGLTLLSEVSLGKSNELLAADYNAHKLPADCKSVKGLGKLIPNPEEEHTLPDGTIVPFGKAVESGVINPKGYTLNYNEYIVYDVNQVRMRYLVKIKFNFK